MTPSSAKRPKDLRMKELMQATGLPKSTLLYYVDQELLPHPRKTSPNMAFYAPQCVERAAFIRSLQSEYRLPLAKIKTILQARDRGVDIAPMLALNQVVFGDQNDELLSRRELCRLSGLTPAQLESLESRQLLLPLSKDGYDAQDLAMASMLAKGLAQGVEAEDLTFYPKLARQIVDQEMGLRHRLTHDLSAEQDAARTAIMVQAARAMRGYVIDRIFQLRIAAASYLKDPELLR
ncbi:hypothetical protein AAU61_08955 [Desulfocarbo indianensis]|nr:hypothetical protein AAU61_08955 [Desulfocarbo indianensis]